MIKDIMLVITFLLGVIILITGAIVSDNNIWIALSLTLFGALIVIMAIAYVHSTEIESQKNKVRSKKK